MGKFSSAELLQLDDAIEKYRTVSFAVAFMPTTCSPHIVAGRSANH